MEATSSTESPTTGEIRPFTVDILQEDAWEEPELSPKRCEPPSGHCGDRQPEKEHYD